MQHSQKQISILESSNDYLFLYPSTPLQTIWQLIMDSYNQSVCSDVVSWVKLTNQQWNLWGMYSMALIFVIPLLPWRPKDDCCYNKRSRKLSRPQTKPLQNASNFNLRANENIQCQERLNLVEFSSKEHK